MKNLGRILLIMIAMHVSMIASVKATLQHNPIIEGDAAVLIIEVEGEKIEFPKIEEISGVKIAGKSTTRSMISINGKMKKTLIRKYTFSPQQEMLVPSFEVLVDGEKIRTEPINLKIKKDIQNGKEAFIFEQKVDKEEVYVGEPIVLSYLFKQRADIDISEANFNAPSFSGFWAKTTARVPNDLEDGYNIYHIKYLLYPQKSGVIKIESGRMDVAVVVTSKRDYFNFQQAKWKTIYSNPLEVTVKELPQGVDTYGDYTFTVVVDKNVTKANEPVNLTITIQGEGNMDNIEDFKLDVPNATVYSDKAKRNSNIFKQKFAIVSDRNFTIPSIPFTFFNGEVHAEHSREFKIEVKNARLSKVAGKLEKKNETSTKVITKEVVVEKTSLVTIMITAMLSFLAGLLVSKIFAGFGSSKNKRSERPIQVRIKNAKEDKALLALLLPYMDKTPKIQKLIRELEENIYGGKSHKIDRKKLSSEFDTYLKIDKEEEILHV